MTAPKLSPDFRHRIPKDLQTVLEKEQNKDVKKQWKRLTPLARNEWICWVTTVKQDRTREEHLKRLPEDIRKGHKRPCCWPGCPHRNPKAAKFFSKQNK